MGDSTQAIVLVTGASGAGKTTLVRELERRAILDGVAMCETDAHAPEEIAEGPDVQGRTLEYWISRLLEDPTIGVAVIDTQIRPHRAREIFARMGMERSLVVLVDCAPEERNRRLRGPRRQPDLANAQMDAWAAYLRGQADALSLPIIDTAASSIEEAILQLAELIRSVAARRA